MIRRISRRRAIALGTSFAVVGAAGVAAAKLIGPGADVIPGRSRAAPIEGDPTNAPLKTDVVVIGGGNSGSATAYYLAKHGLSVVLCEKGKIGGEASCRSVGHVNNLWAEKAKVPLSHLATQLWPKLNEELQAETGYRQDGLLIKISSEQERQSWTKWIADSGPVSGGTRFLDRAQIGNFVDTQEPWFGAVYDSTSGRAEPTLASPAFASAARRLGAKILLPCAVRGIETSGGRVSGVVTEHGRIAANNVVLAGGSWTAAMLYNMSINVPIATVFSWAASVHTREPGPKGNSIFDGLTWRSRIDGGYTVSSKSGVYPLAPALFHNVGEYLKAEWGQISGSAAAWPATPRLGGYFFDQLSLPSRWSMDETSPFEKRRILEPALDKPLLDQMFVDLKRRIPAFRSIEIDDMWGGAVANRLDSVLPAFGPVASVPGLVVVAAAGNGLGLAPAIGSTLADVVAGKLPTVDPKPFEMKFMA